MGSVRVYESAISDGNGETLVAQTLPAAPFTPDFLFPKQ